MDFIYNLIIRLCLKKILCFVLIITSLRAQVTNGQSTDEFCAEWAANGHRFDFGSDDHFSADMFQLAYIGNNSRRVTCDSTGGQLVMSPTVTRVSSFAHKYEMSFVYVDKNMDSWSAFYKEDRAAIDLKQIGSSKKAMMANLWYPTAAAAAQFKPSLAFGPLDGPDLKAGSVVFIIEQKSTGNALYDRVTRVYGYNDVFNSLIDKSASFADKIPKFIDKLDKSLHINIIFPMHSVGKYAVIFDDKSGPKWCLTPSDATGATVPECSTNRLNVLISCPQLNANSPPILTITPAVTGALPEATTQVSTVAPVVSQSANPTVALTEAPTPAQTVGAGQPSPPTQTGVPSEAATVGPTDTTTTKMLSTEASTASVTKSQTEGPAVSTDKPMVEITTDSKTTISSGLLTTNASNAFHSTNKNERYLPIIGIVMAVFVVIILVSIVFCIYFATKKKNQNKKGTLEEGSQDKSLQSINTLNSKSKSSEKAQGKLAKKAHKGHKGGHGSGAGRKKIQLR